MSPPPPHFLQLSVANRQSAVIKVDIDDVQEFDEDLATAIQVNTRRYSELFAKAIDEIAMQPTEDNADGDSILDVFINHREILHQTAAADQTQPGADRSRYPPSLMRR